MTEPGAGHGDGVVPEVRHLEIAEELAAVGNRVGAHAALAFGGEFGQLGDELAGPVEEFLRLVALHPFLQQLEMLRLLRQLREGDLVRAPRAFGGLAIDFFGAGPAFGRAQDDHGPDRALLEAVGAGVFLDLPDLRDHLVEGGRHELVHLGGLVAFDEVGLVAVAAEQLFQFGVADAGEHGRAGDLVAVQVQDGEHGAVVHGVEELVRMPTGGHRPGLRLAVADDAGDEQVGIIEGRAIGMGQGVAEFAAFVDRAGSFGRDVAGDAAGERELREQPLHPRFVLGDVGI